MRWSPLGTDSSWLGVLLPIYLLLTFPGDRMSKILIFVACLLILASASAQQKKSTTAKTKSAETSSLEATLEPKVRKSWEDYKNRNKEAFAASLASNFAEVTDGADGIFGKDTELSEMDHFNLAKYELKDFKVTSIGYRRVGDLHRRIQRQL